VYRSRLDEADAALREAQEAGSDLLELAPLLFTWTAQLASARGDLGARRVAYTEAVRAYREIGDVRRAAGAEMNLADVHNRLGDYAGAERSLREALVQCKRLGNRLMEGYALANLGYALTALGRSDEALRVFEEGKTLATAIGESRLNVSIELYRARCLAESDPEQAIVIAERAIADAKALGYESIVAMASIVASRAELACGRAERALGLSEGAMAIRDRLGSIEEDEADFFVVHALALEALGRTDEARATRARGLARVSELAACIEDAALRDRFATGIAAHRDLARPDV
jgi:tetratricopeptide (TPR) repeat protein